MKSNLKIAGFIAIIVACLIGCGKKDEVIPSDFPCLYSGYKTAVGDTIIYKIEYNWDRKESKKSLYKKGILNSFTTKEYSDNKVIEKDVNSSGAVSSKTYYLGSNGYAATSVKDHSSPNTTYYDSCTFLYDTEGYLIKKTVYSFSRPFGGVFKTPSMDVINYTIKDGNTVASTNLKYSSTSEFYSDKLNYNNAESILEGKADRNLVKKYSFKTPSISVETNTSYTFDSEGRADKKTSVTKIGTEPESVSTHILTYDCK